jgi:hypothetical protein
MKEILWALTILGSLLGAFIAVTGVMNANGAPQEAAAAAMGVACAVIPYCLARAVAEITKPTTLAPKDIRGAADTSLSDQKDE